MEFSEGQAPKKPRRSGAAEWEERRPKRDRDSLAESSKCVQTDVAPPEQLRGSDIEARRKPRDAGPIGRKRHTLLTDRCYRDRATFISEDSANLSGM